MLAHEKRVSDDVVCTRSARAMVRCAGENHISIPPDRFLHLHGQAEIHMYICYMWKQVEKSFLLSFEYLGILAPTSWMYTFLDISAGGQWFLNTHQGRASV
mgnify:CR=1 FL=1